MITANYTKRTGKGTTFRPKILTRCCVFAVALLGMSAGRACSGSERAGSQPASKVTCDTFQIMQSRSGDTLMVSLHTATDGGIQPVWNPKGDELFYRNGSRMMAVPITTGEGFSVGQPKVVFDRPYYLAPIGQTNPGYDVSPDGQRFLMIKEGTVQRTN